MPTLTLNGDFTPVQQALNNLGALGKKPERVLTPLGHILLNSTRDRIVRQVTPAGNPFAALNPVYAGSNNRGPGILRGRYYQNGLYGSLVTQARGNTLRIGSNLIYARIHQFGGVIVPKQAKSLKFKMGGHWFSRQSVTIPARPYLGFTAQDRAGFIDELEGFVARALRTG